MYYVSITKRWKPKDRVTLYFVKFAANGNEGRMTVRIKKDSPEVPIRLRLAVVSMFPPHDTSPRS